MQVHLLYPLTAGLVLFMTLAGCQTPEAAPIRAGATDTSLPEPAPQAEDVEPRETGQRAPVAIVRDHEGRRVNTADLYRRQPTMLVFYRGGWCPYCSEHLRELATIEDDLSELGVHMVGVSPDRPEKLRESLGEYELNYTLLSDSDIRLARAFGLAFHVDDETHQMLLGHDMDIEAASGRSHRVLPVPAVYLIDTNGVIRFAHSNPDYRQRLSGDAIIRAARSLSD